MIEVSSEEKEIFADVGGRPVVTEVLRENPLGIRRFGLLLPSDLITKPGTLGLNLRGGSGNYRWDPSVITVHEKKHDVQVQIRASKTAIKLDETFSLGFTITNRSRHAICVPRRVEPREYGGMFSVYYVEVKSPGSSVFYTSGLSGITSGAYLDSVDDYLEAHLVVRVDPGSSYRATVTGLTISDLMRYRLLQSTELSAGRYILRAKYTGFEFPPHVRPTIAPLDELTHSNELEFTVLK